LPYVTRDVSEGFRNQRFLVESELAAVGALRSRLRNIKFIETCRCGMTVLWRRIIRQSRTVGA
jgi:hypothetical protein